MAASATVSVPKPVPEMPTPLVLPTVRPLIVLPLERLIPLAPLVILVIVPSPLFMAGNGGLLLGGVRPVRLDSELVES